MIDVKNLSAFALFTSFLLTTTPSVYGMKEEKNEDSNPKRQQQLEKLNKLENKEDQTLKVFLKTPEKYNEFIKGWQTLQNKGVSEYQKEPPTFAQWVAQEHNNDHLSQKKIQEGSNGFDQIRNNNIFYNNPDRNFNKEDTSQDG